MNEQAELRYVPILEAELEKMKAQLAARDWTALADETPYMLNVRIKLKDGSELNCITQSGGDFAWTYRGKDIFIFKDDVTHWMVREEADNE